jgi:DNA repair protein REV1
MHGSGRAASKPGSARRQLAERLAAAGARGRTLTLKLKRRKAGAPEPRKFLGAHPARPRAPAHLA